jgi:hypothetical protein
LWGASRSWLRCEVTPGRLDAEAVDAVLKAAGHQPSRRHHGPDGAQDEIAHYFEQSALRDHDERVRNDALGAAARARRRADAARNRARHARQRLIDEGVTPPA